MSVNVQYDRSRATNTTVGPWLHPKCEASLAHVASPILDGDASLFNLDMVLLSLNGIFTCRTLCSNTPPPLQDYAFNTEFTVQYSTLSSIMMMVIRVTLQPRAHTGFDLPPAAAPRLGESWLRPVCPWLTEAPTLLYVLTYKRSLGLRNPIQVKAWRFTFDVRTFCVLRQEQPQVSR
jgi:hypothetical protein